MTTWIMLLAASLVTPWGERVSSENAWREYPRPQLVRAGWTCLNGLWDYTITSNRADGTTAECGKGKILVPFCFESWLSGVGRIIEPWERMHYRRTLDLKRRPGYRLLLNFEAVDYLTQVFVNGIEATDVPHEGGNLPFAVDITDLVCEGTNQLEVAVIDTTIANQGGRGKQSVSPNGCFYTRVSGIWQTVWLEEAPEHHIRDYKVTADIDKGTVRIEVDKVGEGEEGTDISIYDAENRKVGKLLGTSAPDTYTYSLASPHLWTPEDPYLYTFTARCGKDVVTGYFAMRKFDTAVDENGHRRFRLNDKFYFPLGTLDQGWWPDGLLTPPSDAAMEHDIKTLKACGFNMMRKHIKVEPRRYYALCDRLGLLVLQDLPCSYVGDQLFDRAAVRNRYGFQRFELKSMIDCLQKVPSIVMWVPYNEGWGQPPADLTRETLRWTRRYDPTRVVDGPSGWNDWEGGKFLTDAKAWKMTESPTEFATEGTASADTVDFHDYPGPSMPTPTPERVSFLGEFGGLGYKIPGHLWQETNSWGYVDTGAETLKRYRELMGKVSVLIKKGLGGVVYTQTTDVEVEINGLMTYDRKVLKMDVDALREIHKDVLQAANEGNEEK